jgi:uncharacterized protein (TIRG00374 family)
LGKLSLVILPFPLLWWAFQQVPLDQVWGIIWQLEVTQIGIWLFFNALLILLMTGRWWLILRVLGYPIFYMALTRYRLASFAVSYFTPGPQFGGEPLQVLALRQRHQIPGAIGTASVSLDKLLELIANFSFLVFGIVLALSGAWLPEGWRSSGILLSTGLLAIPLAYLVGMLKGKKPLTWLIAQLPEPVTRIHFSGIIMAVEDQMSGFCVQHQRTILAASLISISVWVGMIGEYWLMTRFLGLNLTFPQAVSALVAVRLALLTPLPGGLGALEASQILAIQTLGLPPSFGVSIALMIRFRDLFFGVIGLFSVVPLLGWQSLIKVKDAETS